MYLHHSSAFVATADLNHDGKPDLIIGPLIVLFGHGDGTFAPPVSYPVPAPISACAVADVDGDGNADLITLDGSPSVHVFRSRADGSLQAPDSIYVGFRPYGTDIAAADLDGDGRPDLVLTEFVGGGVNLRIMLNNGVGGFSAPQSLGFAAGYGLAIGDLDGDGRPDVAYGAEYFPNLSGGSFGPAIVVGDPTMEGYPVVADLNRDGLPDLLTSGSLGGGDWSVGVIARLGTGGGSFAPPRLQLTSVGPEAVPAVADLNRDGIPDVVVPAYTPGDMDILLGNNDGTFGVRIAYTTGALPIAVAAADVNGDGHTDVLVLNHDSKTVNVFPGDGSGHLGAPTDLATVDDPTAIIVADLNHDGTPDIVVGSGTSGMVSVYLGMGGGTFSPRADYAAAGSVSALASGDLNGDGRPDVVAVSQASSVLSRFLSNADGTLGPPMSFPCATPATGRALAVADVNNDGFLDAMVLNVAGSRSFGSLSVFPGAGDGGFGTRIDNGVTFGSRLAAGDVNNDGKVDFVIVNSGTGMSFKVWLGAGNGTFTGLATQFLQQGTRTVNLGDVNLDGKLDIVTGHGQTGAWRPSFGRGDGVFDISNISYGTGGEATAAVLAPMDGNSSLDIVAVSKFTNTVTILLNTAGYPLSTGGSSVVPHQLAFTSVGPNPSRHGFHLSFATAEPGPVILEVIDLGGRRLSTRSLGVLSPGIHEADFSGPPRLAAGVYWLRLVQGSKSAARRVVISG
jgi:hypothetical protein